MPLSSCAKGSKLWGWQAVKLATLCNTFATHHLGEPSPGKSKQRRSSHTARTTEGTTRAVFTFHLAKHTALNCSLALQLLLHRVSPRPPHLGPETLIQILNHAVEPSNTVAADLAVDAVFVDHAGNLALAEGKSLGLGPSPMLHLGVFTSMRAAHLSLGSNPWHHTLQSSIAIPAPRDSKIWLLQQYSL